MYPFYCRLYGMSFLTVEGHTVAYNYLHPLFFNCLESFLFRNYTSSLWKITNWFCAYLNNSFLSTKKCFRHLTYKIYSICLEHFSFVYIIIYLQYQLQDNYSSKFLRLLCVKRCQNPSHLHTENIQIHSLVLALSAVCSPVFQPVISFNSNAWK